MKKTLYELYRDLLEQKISLEEPLPKEYEPEQLDCLLSPEKYAPVIHTGECGACAYDRACQRSCMFDAIEEDEQGKLFINPSLCTGCAVCVEACEAGNLSASRDVLPAMRAVRRKDCPSYLMIAPAFAGQFGEGVTAGKLRKAFKALGFTGMVEVALFADVLTLKEALEFDAHMSAGDAFRLTSCCCPVWVSMIRRNYKELMPHMAGAVSPMIACGRMIKKLYPDAVTVFAGPCLAKKKEARESDISDAVDYVLTFQEVKDIFEAAHIDAAQFPEEEKEHASKAGRLYARTCGVSEAVKEMAAQLGGENAVTVRAEQAEGTKACMEMLRRIQNGETDANFFEGMGCAGGCVGGPKAILEKERGTACVDGYAEAAFFQTPLENPFVIELLTEMGLDTVEDLLKDDTLLTRKL